MDYFFGSSESPAARRKLRCRIGTQVSNLTTYSVNDDAQPHFIDSPLFTGHVVVRVKNFKGITSDGSPPVSELAYFGSKKRLFSIQVAGRFKQEHTAEDIVFGAEFENKVNPPTGAWIAFKCAALIDPALQTEIYTDKPWLYSPLLCAMNIVNVQESKMEIPKYLDSKNNADMSCNTKNATFSALPDSRPQDILGEWVWSKEKELEEQNSLLFEAFPEEEPIGQDDIAERRKFFQKEKNRKKVVFKPGKLYHFEIFAPFIDLNTFDLTLGINVNLLRYMNNQPIRLMGKCASQKQPLFIIEFDLLKEGEQKSS